MIALGVDRLWLLALLPLAAVPVLLGARASVGLPWLGAVPEDAPSRWLDRGLRAAGALAVAALVLGASGLHRPEYAVERLGYGAHMVLLVDRSSSMDQPFAGVGRSHSLLPRKAGSKGRVSRRLLSELVAERHDDLFGLVAFSTFPIPVLRLTGNHGVVQAGIAAGDFGRGLAETDIGAGLETALGFFEGQPYTGSRIVVLVSDGAGELGLVTRLRIRHLAQRLRVSLYWIYIRTAYGPRILEPPGAESPAAPEPERALHEFFSAMGAPYKAYTAESPEGLRQAIEDVSRLQNLPVRYQEIVARRDLAHACFVVALAGVMVLLVARLLEIGEW